MKKIELFLLLFCLGAFATLLVLAPVVVHQYKMIKYLQNELSSVPIQPIVVHDTVEIAAPPVISKKVVGKIKVPISRAEMANISRDTCYVTDTVFISVDKTQKYYRSKYYSAWVSGYEPSLDSISIYNRTVYVTARQDALKPREYSRWGCDLQLGYGVYIYGRIDDKKIVKGPYIGIGLSYRLIGFKMFHRKTQ